MSEEISENPLNSVIQIEENIRVLKTMAKWYFRESLSSQRPKKEIGKNLSSKQLILFSFWN